MDPLNRSMLPSMPSISTPFKTQCLDDMEDLLPIQPCISTNLEMKSVTADSMRCTITTHNLNFKDMFSSMQGSTVQSSSHVTINLPPVSISDRLTPPKLSNSCQESPLLVVSPHLKKCNSQLSMKNIHKSPTAKPIATAPLPTSPATKTVQSLPISSTSNSIAGCSKSSELNVPIVVKENGCDNEDELAALMTASSTVPRCPKRKPPHLVSKAKSLKEVREAQIMLSMLDPDTDVIKVESSNNFAQEFFNAMKECLEENDDAELFQKVLTVMSEYDVNKTPVIKFYEKIMALLINYPDLSEQFVAFLLPDQALECGKFMDYLKIMNMRNFVKQLKIFFAKQPQQLRFVFAALEKLVQREPATVEDIKASVLPLLKGNSLLVNNFLMLFPRERPPESMMTEFEDMEIDSDHSGNEDEMLTVPDQLDPYGSDVCACLCHDSLEDKLRSRFSHCVSCGTKFIHGKVYLQIGRALRPAKVAFPGYPNQTKRLYIKVFPKIKGRKRAETVTKGVQVSPKSEMSSVEVGVDSKNTSPKSSRTTKPKVTTANKSRASTSKCTQTVNTNKTAAHVRTTAGKASTPTSSTSCELTSRHCLSPSSSYMPVESRTVTFHSAPVTDSKLPATVLLLDYNSTIVHVTKDISNLVSLAEESQEYVKMETNVNENSNNNTKKPDVSIDFQSASVPFSNEYIPVENQTHFECNYTDNTNTVKSFDSETLSDRLDMSNECVPLETNFINDYMEKCETAISLQSNNGSTEFYNSISSTFDSSTSSEICHEEAYLSNNLEYNPPDEYISMDTYFEENCVLTKNILINHRIDEDGMNCSSTTDESKPHFETDTSNAARLLLETQGDSCPVVTTSTAGTSLCKEEALHLETGITSSVVCKTEPMEPVPSTSEDVATSPRSDDSSAFQKNATANKISRPWTKDEDKVILLEVRRGYCLDKTLQNIQGLPQRTLKEICERFHMLMKMLQEMTVPKEEDSSSSSSSTI